MAIKKYKTLTTPEEREMYVSKQSQRKQIGRDIAEKDLEERRSAKSVKEEEPKSIDFKLKSKVKKYDVNSVEEAFEKAENDYDYRMSDEFRRIAERKTKIDNEKWARNNTVEIPSSEEDIPSSRQVRKKAKKTERANADAKYAEAKKERIIAERDLSQEKKKAYCEKHPLMCRIRYGKQKDENEEIVLPDFNPHKGMEEKGSGSKESMVTVNINQGGANSRSDYSVEEKPRKDYAPKYADEPSASEPTAEKKKKTFCEKHPKICRTGKKVAAVEIGAAVVATDVALTGGALTESMVSDALAKKMGRKKTAGTRSAKKPSAPRKPASTSKSNTAKKKATPPKCDCSKASSKKGTTNSQTTAKKKTTTPKKPSQPKKKNKGKGGMWEYGSAGLFD
ncbi:MAG: hypothetical protein IIY21_04215 [Clostridiales bacterium]|nr:hypothetical protein [Clostridiales bacterium]MBQ1573910.1 hypothetical protein [Clostridiales bacterium]